MLPGVRAATISATSEKAPHMLVPVEPPTRRPRRSLTRRAVAIDADDIGGVVTGAIGPEAGVWVIAETTDLPTKFARIVVTDDQGRYVLPDMPAATYNVWVRGYGLVDSPRVLGVPGEPLDLTAVVAPTPQAAAQYYPPNYWLSIMQLPDGPGQQQAAGIAGRMADLPADLATRVNWAYELIFARPPSQQEIDRAAVYLEEVGKLQEQDADWQEAAWAGYLRGMISSNEFLFVE